MMKTNPPPPEPPAAKLTAVPASARLQDHLRSLRLTYLLENAVPAAEAAAQSGQGHLQFLQGLIAGEIALRQDRSVQRRIQDARFPVIKTLAGWDWTWPAKINRMQVEHLLELEFLASCTNVIFAGPTGTGKTHLALALGHAACLRGHRVLFAAAIDIVNRLSAAESNRQLARELKRYQSPELLLIDELGYLPDFLAKNPLSLEKRAICMENVASIAPFSPRWHPNSPCLGSIISVKLSGFRVKEAAL